MKESEKGGVEIPGKEKKTVISKMFLCIVWLLNWVSAEMFLPKNPPGGIPVAVDVRSFLTSACNHNEATRHEFKKKVY